MINDANRNDYNNDTDKDANRNCGNHYVTRHGRVTIIVTMLMVMTINKHTWGADFPQAKGGPRISRILDPKP